MTAVRRMKLKMTRRERQARRERAIPSRLMTMAKLTPGDAKEVRRFAAFLRDVDKMLLPALIEKHGAAYLGFTEEEVAAINEKAESMQENRDA